MGHAAVIRWRKLAAAGVETLREDFLNVLMAHGFWA
jgi:hypothetical protein